MNSDVKWHLCIIDSVRLYNPPSSLYTDKRKKRQLIGDRVIN